MKAALATTACFILLALTCLQLALIAGFPLGRYAWGGQHDVLPMNLRLGSLVAVLLYALFALVILQQAGLVNSFAARFDRMGSWLLAGYFTLGILMNALSKSPSERLLMTPVNIVLAICCWGLALSTRR